jgi:hypothetical protein
MMEITIHLITGIMFGVEYVEDDFEEDVHHLVIDIGFVRVMFTWD